MLEKAQQTVEKLVDNFGEVKPTLMFAVPRIFNRIYDGLQKRMAAQKGVAKLLFDRGLTGGSSGNISVRIDDGWLMTPTGSTLGTLDPARISKLKPKHCGALRSS